MCSSRCQRRSCQVLSFGSTCRIVVVIVLSVTLLLILLTILQVDPPTQAGGLEYASPSDVGRSNDIIQIPESGVYHGAVTDLDGLDELECSVRKKFSLLKIYQAFWHEGFFDNLADRIDSHGAVVFLNLDPIINDDPSSPASEVNLNACQVLSGDYDNTIITFATQIKNWEQTLLFSFAGEMNGDWAGWSGAKSFGLDCNQTYTETTDLYTHYGCITPTIECADGPERYRDMYCYVHDIFATEGVTNVTWVWVVNHESFPDDGVHPWNQLTSYYPGDAYVDVISVDGYNWGRDELGGWRAFDEVFSETLTTLSNTYPTKPLILGEFASAEGTTPISKANWITNAYSHITSTWPSVKAVVWYNSAEGGDPTFPITSSIESLRAYRQAVADPFFIGDSECCYLYLPLIRKEIPLNYCTDSNPCEYDPWPYCRETITVPHRTLQRVHFDLKKRRVLPNGKQYGFSLWEVEVYSPNGRIPPDEMTATASSWEDSEQCPDCLPAKVVDGNLGTRWASEWSEPQYLTITFARSYVVDRIILDWEQAYAAEYCVTE
jgi:hypothetical protein